ncbi:odorant receptor 10a-like isoform X8 [Temnothorax longispinosus]|uniref:odorant receptor 10a-like isoform X8 n=1 Tax=Temnothorax longispinosus TaxID=300112 RepID=UPI003A991B01
MLENFVREYNINRILLSISGLWPFQSKHVRNSLRTIYLLLEITYYPFEMFLLYDHWGNPQMIFDAGYQFIFTTSFTARALHSIWNQNRLQQLCIAIDKHWDVFTDDVEVRVMKDYSLLSRRFTKLFVGVNITMGVDCMHIACAAHACSLFAAISKQIENIISKANNNNKPSKCGYHVNMELNPLNEKIIYREYIICLKKHQLAIEFVNILESSFQDLSLLLLLLLLANISLVGIRILNVLDQMQQLLKFMLLFTALLFDLLIVCYSGQRLMDESQNIFYRAYAAEWYKFSPRIKSLLMITLYRSNTPCGLKAGKMIPLCIATYAAVVRMAMSYFAAFKSFQE